MCLECTENKLLDYLCYCSIWLWEFNNGASYLESEDDLTLFDLFVALGKNIVRVLQESIVKLPDNLCFLEVDIFRWLKKLSVSTLFVSDINHLFDKKLYLSSNRYM